MVLFGWVQKWGKLQRINCDMFQDQKGDFTFPQSEGDL